MYSTDAKKKHKTIIVVSQQSGSDGTVKPPSQEQLYSESSQCAGSLRVTSEASGGRSEKNN